MNLHERLRLQIEVPTGGLPNLLRNPSGELLAAGWSTPFPNSVFSRNEVGGVQVLELMSQATTSMRLFSEPVAAIPGDYFVASIQSHSTNGGFNIWLQALNSAGTAISSSASSSFYAHSANRQYSPVWQTPAGTVKVRVVIDLYGNTSGASPAVGTYLRFREAMLVRAASTSALATTRTNLVTNPSFETNATGWTGGARATGAGAAGTAHYAVPRTSASGILATGAKVAVTPGKAYTLSAAVSRPAGGTGTIVAQATFGQYKGTDRSIVGYGAGVPLTTSWQRATTTYVVPAGVTHLEPRFRFEGDPGAVRLDAVLLEETGTVNPYFDGAATLPGATCSWNGTAHASTSKAVAATAGPYNEARDWMDVLGPTHSIDIDTSALDVGVLTAEILDADLDPALVGTVRPGKRIRLQAYVENEWEDVYVGETTEGTTAYAKDKGGSLSDTGAVRIVVTAANAIKALANQGESRGVEEVSHLATLLEGKGVPWILNGVSRQAADAAVISVNENASMLDQIAITRDSNQAYAWVDRHNVLNVESSPPAVAVATFTDELTGSGVEYSYTDADISYSTSRCINQVTLKYLRYNAADSSTEEITYGPYIDQESVETYGAFAAEFTVQSMYEDPGWLEYLADQILVRNAVPSVTANSLTMKAADELGLKLASTIDLYTPVTVKYADRVDSVVKVAGIKHSIRATANGRGSWETTYDFEPVASVASPTQTPAPPATGANAVGLLSARYRTTTQSIPSLQTTTLICDAADVSDGIPYSAGVWTVPKSGRYLVNAQVQFVATAGAHNRWLFIYKGTTLYRQVVVANAASANQALSLSAMVKCQAGDEVSIRVQQGATGSVNVQGGATRYTFGDITYLGI